MQETLILAGAILLAAFMLYRGIRGLALVVFEGLLRGSFLANFSRFGDIDEDNLAVFDERGYFVRGHTMWVADVVEGELDKSTGRPLDLFDRDSQLLREARQAVALLNRDIQDQFKDN